MAADSDLAQLKKVITEFCYGDSLGIEKVKAYFKSEATIMIMNKDIAQSPLTRFVLVQTQDEVDDSRAFLKSLKLAIPTEVLELSELMEEATVA